MPLLLFLAISNPKLFPGTSRVKQAHLEAVQQDTTRLMVQAHFPSLWLLLKPKLQHFLESGT